MKMPPRDMFAASREETWRIECRSRALGVIKRAINIAMTKLDDAEEAAQDYILLGGAMKVSRTNVPVRVLIKT